MNTFFEGFVYLRTTIKEFVNQFDNTLKKNVENKMATYFNSSNYTISFITHLPMNKKFHCFNKCTLILC